MSSSEKDEYELPRWNQRPRARSRKSDASAIDRQHLITHGARSKAARRTNRKISRSVEPSRTNYNKRINEESKDDESSQQSELEQHSDEHQQLPLQKNSTDEVIANAKDQTIYISQPCFNERLDQLEKEMQALKKSAEVSAIQSNEIQDNQQIQSPIQVQIPFVDNSSEELDNISAKSSKDSSNDSSKDSSNDSSKDSSNDSSKDSSDNINKKVSAKSSKDSSNERLKKIPKKSSKKPKKHRKGSTSSDSASNYSTDSMSAKEIRSETEKIRKSVPDEKLTNAIKGYIYDRLDVYNIQSENGLSEQMHMYNTTHKMRILTDIDLMYIIAMAIRRSDELGTKFIKIEYEDSNDENGYSCILCGCIPIGKPEVKLNTIRKITKILIEDNDNPDVPDVFKHTYSKIYSFIENKLNISLEECIFTTPSK